MQEQQRRDYLQAMGIPVWIPRRELPFAAPSRLLSAEQAAAEARESQDNMALAARLHGQASAMAALDDLVPPRDSHHAASGPSSHPDASSRPGSADSGAPSLSVSPSETSVKADSNAVNRSASQSSATEVAETVPVVDMTPPRFELHCVLTGPVLWMCDDQMALPSLRQFAARVAMAMKYPPETLSPVTFHWPFIDNPREDQSAPVARQALAAQWSFFQHHGARALVGFGEKAVTWAQPLCQQHHVVAESVMSVMSDASQKRQLWLSLRSWAFESPGE